MLIYHPAYDAYHCVFRTLLITNIVKIVEVSKLRILDFFMCFPAELRHIRLPREHLEARTIAAELKNEYHGPVSMRQAFRDMEHIQIAAFRTLAASQLFDGSEFSSGLIRRTDTELPSELSQQLASASQVDGTVLSYITKKLADLPLQGVDGLKHRTGLMEHRYDIA